MRPSKRAAAALTIGLLLGAVPDSYGDWPPSPTVNLQVCVAPGFQSFPAIAPDGKGGLFVVWWDQRSGNWRVYAQRLDGAGVRQWAANGVQVGPSMLEQTHPRVEPDGTGGAFVVWEWESSDFGTSSVFAQHLDAVGAALWAADGVPVAPPSAGDQWDPIIVSDGSGGAIVSWREQTGARAQHLSSAGALLWTSSGTKLSNSWAGCPGAMIPDGSGGAMIAYAIGGGLSAYRLDASGVKMWTRSLVTIPIDFESVLMIGDESQGAIVGWAQGYGAWNVYAQRLDPLGSPLWPAGGVTVCDAPDNQHEITMAPDGNHGAILAWRDERNSLATDVSDVYAQRILSTGAPAWSVNGVVVCDAPQWQMNPVAVNDDSGGVTVAWVDARLGLDNQNLYAQHIHGDGQMTWATNGILVRQAAYSVGWPSGLATRGGGAVYIWNDERNVTRPETGDLDIYGQNVNKDGSLGGLVVGTQLALVRAEAAVGGPIRLVWFSPTYLRATLYRSVDSDGWAAVCDLWPDGTGILGFEDRDVVAGHRYGYRLGVRSGGVEEYFGEAWVMSPQAAGFAIEAVRPNPPVGAFTVDFSLTSLEPASLSVLDLAGRQRIVREIAGASAGNRVARLNERSELEPGFYVLRLTQGSRSVTRSLAILR